MKGPKRRHIAKRGGTTGRRTSHRASLQPRDSLHLHPSDARAARALCGGDVRAECPSRVRGVHEGLWGTLGVHVVHFSPMCLTARISLGRPMSHITPRTGPTRFDVRSSPGGRAEWALGEHPHVPGGRIAAWLGAGDG